MVFELRCSAGLFSLPEGSCARNFQNKCKNSKFYFLPEDFLAKTCELQKLCKSNCDKRLACWMVAQLSKKLKF